VHVSKLKFLAALAAAGVAVQAGAATSVTLPAWACSNQDAVFIGGFEDGALVPHDPSNGSGGAYPGKQTRTLQIAGLGSGTQNYYVYLPLDYTPTRSWPMLLALHGVAPFGDSYAKLTRSDWIAAAAAGHFIVVAPVADQIVAYSGGQPYAISWLISSAYPSDLDLFAAVRADMESAYNIERTRVYGWGFSSGAHVMDLLGVTDASAAFNANTMAAYSVSSGVLQAWVCPGPTDAGCASLLTNLPRKIPVDIHIGNTDPNYTQAAADHNLFVAEGWSDGQTIHYTEFDGDHTYTIAQLTDIWNNICPNAVVP
jgi:poly(3-hydroxybutyrate) depolymerase